MKTAIITSAISNLAFANISFETKLINSPDPFIQGGSTNTVSPNKEYNFSSCSCNLTPNACDAECCCDPDCDSGVISNWKINGLCDN